MMGIVLSDQPQIFEVLNDNPQDPYEFLEQVEILPSLCCELWNHSPPSSGL